MGNRDIGERGSYGAGDRFGQKRKRSRSFLGMFGLVVLLLWSGVAYLGYFTVDAVLAWLATSGDAVLQTSRNVGTAIGAGQEVNGMLEGISSTGLWGQIISLLQALLKPVVVTVWLVGAVVIVVLPRLLGKLIGRFIPQSR